MTLVIPTIPAMPAGYIATANDMNNLAAAATFLLGKPMARVHDGTGALAIGTSDTGVPFSVKDYDTDGMWASGSNTKLTIQTPGWYKFRYMVASTGGKAVSTKIRATTGPNNPQGSGVSAGDSWAGYSVTSATAGTDGSAGCSGIWPYYLYIGDFLQVFILADSTGGTTVISTVPSFLALEFVST